MTIPDLLTELKTLSVEDKWQVLKFLADDLSTQREGTTQVDAARQAKDLAKINFLLALQQVEEIPLWSQFNAAETAEAMRKIKEQERNPS